MAVSNLAVFDEHRVCATTPFADTSAHTLYCRSMTLAGTDANMIIRHVKNAVAYDDVAT